MSVLTRLRLFARDRRAGVAIVTAFGLTMLIGVAAFAVDLGSLFLDRRKLQGIADAAVMAAAAKPGDERLAAERIIAANCDCGITIASLTTGIYTPDVRIAAEQRFAPGGLSPNAVQISLRQARPLFFGRFLTGRSDSMIGVTATGTRRGYAAFSLGSRVAAVHGGVPNALLSALTGSEVNLSVMDYEALAKADIDLLAFSDALRSGIDADVLTFGQTLDSQVTLPQVLAALAGASDGRAGAALGRLASGAAALPLVPSNAIDLGPRSSSVRVDAADPVKVNALSLLRAMLALSNANRQVDLSLASDLPGGSGIKLALMIGEPAAQSPLIAITDTQEVIVRTAQVRLRLETRISTPIASVDLPVVAELGSASARIADIDCRRGASDAVSLAVTTSPAMLAIASVDDDDFQNMQRPLNLQTARLLHLPLASVEGKAQMILSDLAEQPVGFSRDDIREGEVKTVSSKGLVAGAAKSLADRMELRVNIIGIGLSSKVLTSLVGDTVALAAPALDKVIEGVTDVLGVHVGQADARVNALRCGRARLV